MEAMARQNLSLFLPLFQRRPIVYIDALAPSLGERAEPTHSFYSLPNSKPTSFSSVLALRDMWQER